MNVHGLVKVVQQLFILDGLVLQFVTTLLLLLLLLELVGVDVPAVVAVAAAFEACLAMPATIIESLFRLDAEFWSGLA